MQICLWKFSIVSSKSMKKISHIFKKLNFIFSANIETILNSSLSWVIEYCTSLSYETFGSFHRTRDVINDQISIFLSVLQLSSDCNSICKLFQHKKISLLRKFLYRIWQFFLSSRNSYFPCTSLVINIAEIMWPYLSSRLLLSDTFLIKENERKKIV